METKKDLRMVLQPISHLMVANFLAFTSTTITFPFLLDILVEGVCDGDSNCNQVIFLLGALQLGTGIGTVLISPILGGISDDHGRKPVFSFIFWAAVFPQALLVFSRTGTVIYIFLALWMIASFVREGGLVPTILAAVADMVDHNQRATAVGLTMGSLSVGLLVGTLAALVIKTIDQAILIGAILQIFSAIYFQLLWKETHPRRRQHFANKTQAESVMKLLPKNGFKRQATNFLESGKVVMSSRRFIVIAMVGFLYTFGLSGLYSFALYFLKSQFDYGKNEYAIITLVASVGAALGQMLVYPIFSYFLGDRGVLWIGIIFNGLHYFVYGLSWARWVPYIASGLSLFYVVIIPALGTMVSKGVDQDQQGKVQGFMGGLRSIAAIVAPLVITPITAISLGENPPFGQPGFPFFVCGFAMIVALFISLALPPLPAGVHSLGPTEYIQAPLPPEDFVRLTPPPEDLLQVPLRPEAASLLNSNDVDENHV